MTNYRGEERHGGLYQLQCPPGTRVGDIVSVNGPWDTWGRVLELRPNGFHLIRGIGHNHR